MAINKVINDATKKYEPLTTETVVFDTVPTVNSFNAVTSDGVARAIAGGGIQSDDIKSAVVVSEPPSNPDSKTLYLIPEA